MSIAYLCLGSNAKDSFKLIEQALSFLDLSEGIKIIRSSSLYETEPWGVKDQNWFLNMVAEIKTNLSPEDLLVKCNQIESALGRNREKERHWGERPIDIDIIFYDSVVMNSELLTIPHKYMHKRAFVLVPLLEIIPDFNHPVFNKTISQLYDALENVEEVFLYGARIYD